MGDEFQVPSGSWLMLWVCSLSVGGHYMFVFALLYGSERMIWRENERSRIRTVQMDNFRGLLGIKIMDRMPNERIRELCGVTKEV